jgi:hypothetical protein
MALGDRELLLGVNVTKSQARVPMRENWRLRRIWPVEKKEQTAAKVKVSLLGTIRLN